MLLVFFQSCVPNTDVQVTFGKLWLNIRTGCAVGRLGSSDRTRICLQKQSCSRLKDLHRSYIPGVGFGQCPLAAKC
jgi:hypothetical protein